MNRNRYVGAAFLCSLMALFLGCTALGGGNKVEDDRKVVITGVPQKLSPDAEQALEKRIDKIIREADEKLEESSRILNLSLPEQEVLLPPKPKQQQCCRRPGVPAPAASAPVAQASAASAPAVVASAPPVPAAPLQVTSKIGDLNFWTHIGYQNGALVYRPWWGNAKSLAMTEQVVRLGYECTALVPGTQHVATIVVTAAVKPAIIFEEEFHRFVAAYATVGGKHSDKNAVTSDDVHVGALTYLGKQHEQVCAAAKTRSLADVLDDPGLGMAKVLNSIVASDPRSPFDIFVQTTNIELPAELLRALAKKALEQPPAPKPVDPPPAKRRAPSQQTCCTTSCVQQCTMPNR